MYHSPLSQGEAMGKTLPRKERPRHHQARGLNDGINRRLRCQSTGFGKTYQYPRTAGRDDLTIGCARVKRQENHCRAKKDLATTRREVSTMGSTAAFDVSLLDSARDINTLGLPAGMI